MAEPSAGAHGPFGDPARHRPLAALEVGLRALPAPPRDAGWSRRPPRDPEAQLAVMRRDVAELIAGGQSLAVFGDNLFVDPDLSAANLPAGTLLRVGQALVAVSVGAPIQVVSLATGPEALATPRPPGIV